MRMTIEGISYNVKDYSLRFRMNKRKILLLTVLIALSLITAVGMAHADPSTWPTWAGGGGGRAVRW